MRIFRILLCSIVILGNLLFMSATGSAQEKVVGDNLVPNPSFEVLNESLVPAPFRLSVYQGAAEVSVDNAIARTGSNSVRITGRGADRGLFSIRIPVQGGKIYRVSLWYKATSTIEPGKVIGRLMAYKTDGSAEDDKVKASLDWLVDPWEGEYQVSGNNLHILNWQQGGGDWQILTAAIRLPQDVIAVAIEGFNWLGNGTVWFDDISLHEVTIE